MVVLFDRNLGILSYPKTTPKSCKSHPLFFFFSFFLFFIPPFFLFCEVLHILFISNRNEFLSRLSFPTVSRKSPRDVLRHVCDAIIPDAIACKRAQQYTHTHTHTHTLVYGSLCVSHFADLTSLINFHVLRHESSQCFPCFVMCLLC